MTNTPTTIPTPTETEVERLRRQRNSWKKKAQKNLGQIDYWRGRAMRLQEDLARNINTMHNVEDDR